MRSTLDVAQVVNSRDSEQLAGVGQSVAAVAEVTEKVDFEAMQQDLERVNGILIKVGELQDAAQVRDGVGRDGVGLAENLEIFTY